MEVEKSLKKRRKGAAVRLELAASSSRMIRDFLRDELQLEERDIYSIPGPLDCKVFFSFVGIDGYDDLRYPPVTPQPSSELAPSTRLISGRPLPNGTSWSIIPMKPLKR